MTDAATPEPPPVPPTPFGEGIIAAMLGHEASTCRFPLDSVEQERWIKGYSAWLMAPRVEHPPGWPMQVPGHRGLMVAALDATEIQALRVMFAGGTCPEDGPMHRVLQRLQTRRPDLIQLSRPVLTSTNQSIVYASATHIGREVLQIIMGIKE